MKNWDPMSEDFHSSRNKPSLRDDDVEVAFHGRGKFIVSAEPVLLGSILQKPLMIRGFARSSGWAAVRMEINVALITRFNHVCLEKILSDDLPCCIFI